METSSFYLLRNSAYMNMGVHLTVELFRVTALIVSSTIPIIPVISVTFGMILNDPDNTIYDPPQQRFEAMRRTLVEELNTIKDKNTKAANEQRKRILDGISVIDKLLETVKDKDNLYQFIWNTLTPKGRRSRAAVDYQRAIGKYMSNDLRIASAMFNVE